MELVKTKIRSAVWLASKSSFGIFIFSLVFTLNVFAGESVQFGPLFNKSPLILDSGTRTEMLGPFFYSQQKESEKTWAIPPLFSHDADSVIGSREDDFFYPILTYESYGREYRWQLVQLLSFSGGQNQNDTTDKRFTIFPVYFQQRSTDPGKNYTAVFPFYGHLQNRLFRDRIFFVMFPIYGETWKKDVVNENYLYPFFNVRHGDGMHGWQFWPIIGAEHKIVTTYTNGWGDVETNAGHDHFFALWPIHFSQNNGIGTDDPEKIRANLPLYYYLRSPKLDSTSVLWPFFTWINDREKKYHEWQGPWPFVIFARGDKTTSRVWPLYSRSHNKELTSNSYLWPVYTFRGIHADPLDRRRMRIFYYLYDSTRTKNTETGKDKLRLYAWPFFSFHRDFDGDSRLQILALLEPFLSDNSGVERNWSPLWSIWRSEKNPRTDASSQSFLWNLYRRDTDATSKKCSLLFGFFRYQSGSDEKKVSLFFIPLINSHKSAK